MSFRQYSEVNRAYDSPHYQPISGIEQRQAVQQNIETQQANLATLHRVNLHRYFILGTVAFVAMYPFQRLHTMMQVRSDVRFVAPELNYRWSALKFLIQKQNWAHFFRGVIPGALYWNGTVGSAMVINDISRHSEMNVDIHKQHPYDSYIRGLTSAAALSVSQFILHPLRVASVKLSTDYRIKSLSTSFKYATSADCLMRVVRFNGIGGLFRGAGMVTIRTFVLYLALHYHFDQITATDQAGMMPERGNYKEFLYPIRYEWRALQIYLTLMPLDAIISRRIYRIPTFKTDRLPKQYPKMYLPTFAGWLSMYRGFFAYSAHTFGMMMFSLWLANAYQEALLPPKYRPSNLETLFSARYQQYNRRHDELASMVPQWPAVDPRNTGSIARLRELAPSTSTKNSRFQIPVEILKNSKLLNSLDTTTGADLALPDINGLQEGTYDINAQTYQAPSMTDAANRSMTSTPYRSSSL